MKNFYYFILALFLIGVTSLNTVHGQSAEEYNFSVEVNQNNFVDISTAGELTNMGGCAAHLDLAMPTNFVFNTKKIKTIRLGLSGIVTFHTEMLDGYGSAVDHFPANSDQYYDFIAPFWDHICPAANSDIRYTYLDMNEDPDGEENYCFIVQWSNMNKFNTPDSLAKLTFQMQLYENSTIKFVYGPGFDEAQMPTAAGIGLCTRTEGILYGLFVKPTDPGQAETINDFDYNTNAVNIRGKDKGFIQYGTTYTFTPITTCYKPTDVQIEVITKEQALVTWESPTPAGSTWEIIWGPAGFDPDVTGNPDVFSESGINSPTHLLTGLDNTIAYDVYVRTYCPGETDPTVWSLRKGFSSNIGAAMVPYTCDFENPVENGAWRFDQSKMSNWYISKGAKYQGGKSLFISTDNALTHGPDEDLYRNTYMDGTDMNFSYAYRDIYFPTAISYELQFDWRSVGAIGKSSGKVNDYFLVFFADTNAQGIIKAAKGPYYEAQEYIEAITPAPIWIQRTPPVEGESVGEMQQRVCFWNSEDWTTHIASLDRADFEGKTKRLYFLWSNAAGPNYPNGSWKDTPAAIDNLSITTAKCETPNGLRIQEGKVYANQISIEWDESEQGVTEWQVYYGKEGSSSVEMMSEIANQTKFDITGLEEGTVYQIYIRAMCSSVETSAATSIVKAKTTCGAMKLPYEENFDAYFVASAISNVPTCWEKTSTSIITLPVLGDFEYPGVRKNGGIVALNLTSNGSQRAMATIPMVPDTVDMRSIRLTFDATIVGAMEVGVMTDPSDISTYQRIQSYSATGGWDKKILDFNNYQSGGRYITFATSSTSLSQIDNVRVESVNTCAQPGDIQFTGISRNSVSITWAELGSAENWDVVCVDRGAAPTSKTPTRYNEETSATIASLTANKEYDIYIRSYCEFNSSPWVKAEFRTLCDEKIETLPIQDNFANHGTLPVAPCWQLYTNDATKTVGITNDPSVSDNKSMYLGASSANNYYTYLVVNELGSSIKVEELYLQLKMKAASTGAHLEVGVMDLPYNTASFVSIAKLTPVELDTWETKTVSLEEYYGTGKWVALRVRGIYGPNDVYIDDLKIDKLVPCPAVTNLKVAVSGVAALLTWEDGISGELSNYTITYRQSGGSWSSPEEITAGTHHYYMMNLSENKTYEVQIKTICAGSVESEYTTTSFNTTTSADNCAYPILRSFARSANSVSIEWDGDLGVTSQIDYRKTGETSWTSLETTYSGNTYVVSSLQPSTSYDIRVRKSCAGSRNAQITVTTYCEEINTLPYEQKFTAATLPACYSTKNNGYALPAISSAQASSPTYSALFTAANSTLESYSLLVLSPIKSGIAMNKIMFSMQMRASTLSGGVQLGVMTDPDDINTFTHIETFSADAINTFEAKEISLASYRGDGRYIALKLPNNGSTSTTNYFVDDIKLDYLPTCNPPALTVSNVAANSAKLSWIKGTGDEQEIWEVRYGPKGGSQITEGDIVTTSFDLAGLLENTTYVASIRVKCLNGDFSAWSRNIEFTTECAKIIIGTATPYVENFDTYGTGSSVIPDCWTRKSTYNDNYPYISGTQKYNGIGALNFMAAPNLYSMIVTPQIDRPVKELALHLQMFSNKTKNPLYVGVLTDPNDPETFTVVDSLFVKEGDSWMKGSVYFNSYPGAGKYIALKYTSSEALYVDALTIFEIPACPIPSALTVANYTSTSVTLDWKENGSATNWVIEYKATGGALQTVNADAHPFTIPGLTATTGYEFSVKADCGTTSDNSDVYYFTMPCTPIVLPAKENFDSYTGKLPTVVGELPTCWVSYTNNTEYPNPHIINGIHPSNTMPNALVLMAGSQGNDAYVVLPEYDVPIKEIKIDFMGYVSGPGTLTIGYSKTANDIRNNFYPVQVVPAVSKYELYQINFFELGTIPDDARHIVFYWNSTGMGQAACLDDIYVRHYNYGVCHPPVNITYSDTTISSIKVSWAAGQDEKVWAVERKLSTAGDYISLGTFNTTTTTISNLEEGKEYDLRIKASCPNNDPADEMSSAYIYDKFRTLRETRYYKVYPTVGANGSVTPYDPDYITVKENESLTFDIKANDGFCVKEVYVDGVSQKIDLGQAAIEFTLDNIEKDIFLRVFFGTAGTAECETGIKEEKVDTRVVIFPNPAEKQLFVKLEDRFDEVEIVNMLGQKVYMGKVNNKQFSVNISSYTSGVYFIVLKNENEVITKKFVKK